MDKTPEEKAEEICKCRDSISCFRVFDIKAKVAQAIREAEERGYKKAIEDASNTCLDMTIGDNVDHIYQICGRDFGEAIRRLSDGKDGK